MIVRLDAATVGQIAAGEVVERPQSVVKELVENAIDAGATWIRVAVVRGGLDRIEVVDDGAGIAPGDLPLAVARHATSKLRASADLERIGTLGFRGEGLASIAAVARVRIVSRIAGEEIGFALVAFGESISSVEPEAAPPGTAIVVEDLFGSVPARREYLRSPTAEFTRIATFLATLALAYPHIGFALTHDGRPVFRFPPGGDVAQRLAHVFGLEAARALIAIEPSARGREPSTALDVVVTGHLSRPGVDRGDRRMQLLFINGRLLRSTQLAGAWSAGYAGFALVGRQPFGTLFLQIPPADVDPNVHPTKSDVRLRRPEAVHRAVREAIVATLERDAARRAEVAVSFAPPASAHGLPQAIGIAAAARTASSPIDLPLRVDVARDGADASAADSDSGVTTSALRLLAQLDDTFMLATDGRALVLVDQHAAHERVAYEAIASAARTGAGAREPLLIPFSIELDGEDAERFEASREMLAAVGLEAEPFGERAFRIVATPAGYGARAFDLHAYLADLRREIPGLDARERVWASLACHSVVRAGDRLEPAEMSALLVRLLRCENPMHCPHGRPTIVRIEADAIARLFKRT